MLITLKLAWRDVRAHLRRFLLTIVAVMLGIAFLSATLALRETMSTNLVSGLSGVQPGDIQVRGPAVPAPAVGFQDIPVGLTQEVVKIPGVAQAQPRYALSVTVLDEDNRPASNAGISNTLANALADFNIEYHGNPPSKNDEIAVEKTALERLGLHVGDTVRLLVNDQALTFRITATIDYGHPVPVFNFFCASDALVPTLVDNPDVASAIIVKVSRGSDPANVTSAITQAIGSSYNVKTADEINQTNQENLDVQLGFLTTFLLIFAGLALLISTFIITNTFNMAIKSRLQDFAFLRAVGFAPQRIFSLVAWQAVVIGLIGAGIGLALGTGLLRIATWALDHFGIFTGLHAEISVRVILTAVCVGIVVTLIGALFPARQAAKTPPITAMQQASGANERPVWLRLTIGLALCVSAIICLLIVGLTEVKQSGTILGCGALGLIIGLLIAGPGLVKFILGGISWPLLRLRPLWIRLGAGNALRNTRRTAATGGAVMIGMLLVSAGLVVADSLRASSVDVIDNELQTDLMVLPANLSNPNTTISDAVFDKITHTPGVARTLSMKLAMASAIYPDDPQPETLLVVSSDLAHLSDAFRMKFIAGSMEHHGADSIIVPEQLAHAHHLALGDTLKIATQKGEQSLHITGIQDSSLAAAFIDDSQLEPLGISSLGRMRVLIHVDPHANVETVKAAIHSALPTSGLVAVMDKEELKGFAASVLSQALAIIYALVGLSLFIAGLGIINTLSLSVSERRREIGLSRAIGISRICLAAGVGVESVLTALYGTVLGVSSGIGLAAALAKYLSSSGIKVFSIPVPALFVVSACALLAGLLAALPPAIRASRQPILSAIRD
ncbi:ABC transporter permease [Trueperella sp. LYQ143]|uniref:ABC transporter permease n=1 Tax=Trueperella sp. LYQ143 TaxID=3391059 RepID=UPI00398344EA